MGYKNLCIECRKTFNMGTDTQSIRHADCPDCKNPMILMTHRFRPPRKQDDRKWKVVRFLIDNGFYYQHVYSRINNSDGIKSYENPVLYPESMVSAREFVEKYKAQAITNYNNE